MAQVSDFFAINFVARGVVFFVPISRLLLLFSAGTESVLLCWKVSAVLGSCTAGGAYVPAQTLALADLAK